MPPQRLVTHFWALVTLGISPSRSLPVLVSRLQVAYAEAEGTQRVSGDVQDTASSSAINDHTGQQASNRHGSTRWALHTTSPLESQDSPFPQDLPSDCSPDLPTPRLDLIEDLQPSHLSRLCWALAKCERSVLAKNDKKWLLEQLEQGATVHAPDMDSQVR